MAIPFFTLIGIASLGGCAASAPLSARHPTTVPTTARASSAEPFVQQVPRSTFKFTMLPTASGRPIWLGQTEVTWDAYDVFQLRLDLPADQRTGAAGDPGPDAVTRPTLPYSSPDRGWGHEGFPAIGVTFHAAQQYCMWLSEQTGRRYRLPTVAEWRAACVETPSGVTSAADVAWCQENADEQTHAVAKRPANALGLHDMLGNVAEWCTDEAGNPVVCGGSFLTPAAETSSTTLASQTRAWNQSDPSFPKSKWWLADGPFVGFRVACER